MTTASTEILFQPFTVKSLNLKNRIVMAPMTRSFSPGGVPGENVAAYYERRAAGGVGLILSEGTVVERPASKNEEGIPNFYGHAALAGWKTVIDEVHSVGGRMGPQIWHVGAVPNRAGVWSPPAPYESPSGLAAPNTPLGQSMNDADIADTIAAFARAAADAKRLGFDLVEIHAAHGYLIDQFFWSGTNLRRDKWGGATIEQRSRFAIEIIKAVRTAVGPEFPICVRVSQWKSQDFTARLASTPQEMEAWLQPLVDAGADILHCSQRRFWEAEFAEIDGEKGLNFAGWAKKLTGAATISVGSVGLAGDAFSSFGGETSDPESLDGLVARLENDEFDLIAVGRALLADPQWLAKVERGDLSQLQTFSPAAFGTLS